MTSALNDVLAQQATALQTSAQQTLMEEILKQSAAATTNPVHFSNALLPQIAGLNDQLIQAAGQGAQADIHFKK